MLTAFKARYVFPVSGQPIEDGIVVVEGERIHDVGRSVPKGAKVVDLNERNQQTAGGVAILPGLVNAHTHLEFSHLEQPRGQPGMAFPEWIRAVIEHRRLHAVTPAEGERKRNAAIQRGLQESLRAGTTAIGEIFAGPPSWPHYQNSPAHCVVFREWLGLGDERVAVVSEEATQQLKTSPQSQSGCELGFSPHAPYSTHWRMVEQLCRLAQPRTPVAMHLAESSEELQLLAAHDGPFRELLDDLGVWNADGIPRGWRPMDYLKLLDAAPRALVIHGNYLSEAEIAFLAERASRMSVVYCPRTHAYFKHPPYPLAEMLAAGVNVALGTDSRASNPDLSLLTEMRHLAQHHPNVSPTAILQLATINGARALGLENQIGTLETGKHADLTVVPLTDDQSDDPHELLLQSDLRALANYSRKS